MTTNNTAEIVPPLFLSNKAPPFYDIEPSLCDSMVHGHYVGKKTPLSGFSSWAASLHSVLSFAHSFVVDRRQDVHVAVLDTKNLDDDVYVWNCPHLLAHLGNHEYLAYGPIRGSGYKAVSFEQLVQLGLYKLFPELKTHDPNYDNDGFGHKLRRKMFPAPTLNVPTQLNVPTTLNVPTSDFDIIRQLASSYESLALPVSVALLNIRPRDLSTLILNDCKDGTLGWMRQQLGQSVTFSTLASESWLMEPDMIDTERLPDFRRSFPDVRQWMKLLAHLVVQHDQELKRKAEIAQGTKRKLQDDDATVPAMPEPEKKKRRTAKPHKSQVDKKKKNQRAVKPSKPSLVLVLHLKHLYEETKRIAGVVLGTKRKRHDEDTPVEATVQPEKKKMRTVKTCNSRMGNKKRPSSATERSTKSASRALRPLDSNASSLNKSKPEATTRSDVSKCAVL